MVQKTNVEEEVPEEREEALQEVKKVVEQEKETRFEEIRREIEEFAQSKGEVAKNITVYDHVVTATLYDKDGREVRNYSRKLNK